MREVRNLRRKVATLISLLMAGVRKRQLILAAALLVSICALLAIFSGVLAAALSNQFKPGALLDSLESTAFRSAPDYSRFLHSSPGEHAALMGPRNCASCHRANGGLEPSFPKHKDCTGCHLIQFTAANSSSTSNPICTICHNEADLSSSKAPPKSFSRLRSFDAKFDHAQHLQGIGFARPERGCAFCHGPARGGVAETIPARLDAHRVCYECHAPGKQASNFSSCGSCHGLGRYSATSIAARSYRVGFSHAEHGSRERLNCESCHNVLGRGLPQARQVSSIAPALHRSSARARSCMTCHNGQRAFGDAKPEFVNCKRCHKGPTFRS